MDKLRAITIFIRIVESGSLSKAADVLGTSPTSVVRKLAELEASLGVRLLNRTTRRIALTEEGRDYFERCRSLLAQLAEAEAALSAGQAAPTGRLAITAPVMFGRIHVEPVLSAFLAAHPAMKAELRLLDRITDLLEEGLDLAIRISHLPDSSLVAIPLGHTRRIVCASPGYLAQYGTPQTPEALAEHHCIRFSGLSPDTEWEFAGKGKARRVLVNERLASNQNDATLGACLSGLGCARFRSYQVREHLASGQLVRLLTEFETPPVPINLAYHHTKQLSRRVRAFIDWAVPVLREKLRET